MKSINIIFTLLLLFTAISYSQQDRERMQHQKNKLDQLEKVKLIEALDLDEATSVRFFARRNDSQKEIDALEKKSDETLEQIQNNLDSNDKNIEATQKQLISDFLSTREKVDAKRKLFIISLTDILPTEKIAKYIVFEKKFRDEIRKVLLGKNRRSRD